jgi:hypothetical protein
MEDSAFDTLIRGNMAFKSWEDLKASMDGGYLPTIQKLDGDSSKEIADKRSLRDEIKRRGRARLLRQQGWNRHHRMIGPKPFPVPMRVSSASFNTVPRGCAIVRFESEFSHEKASLQGAGRASRPLP